MNTNRIRLRTASLVAIGILAVAAILMPSTASGEKYLGESFSLGVGGRLLAMGGAGSAGPFDASAAYWNPAGMNSLDGRFVTFMHGETFGSLLNHDFIAYVNSHPADSGLIRSFSLYAYYLGGSGIDITALDGGSRPEVIREESHGDLILGGALASRVSGRLDVGLAGKFYYRDIGTETGWGLGLDAGATYTLHPDIRLGFMVTDITSGFIRYSGKTFNIPAHTETISPALKPGLSISHTWGDWTGRGSMVGDIRFDDLGNVAQYWSGPLSLDMHYGLEVGYRDMIFGRLGADIGRFTAGVGIDFRRFTFDAAYLNHPDLDETIRFSAGYKFR